MAAVRFFHKNETKESSKELKGNIMPDFESEVTTVIKLPKVAQQTLVLRLKRSILNIDRRIQFIRDVKLAPYPYHEQQILMYKSEILQLKLVYIFKCINARSESEEFFEKTHQSYQIEIMSSTKNFILSQCNEYLKNRVLPEHFEKEQKEMESKLGSFLQPINKMFLDFNLSKNNKANFMKQLVECNKERDKNAVALNIIIKCREALLVKCHDLAEEKQLMFKLKEIIKNNYKFHISYDSDGMHGLRNYLERINPNEEVDGYKPLHYACIFGDEQLLMAILKKTFFEKNDIVSYLRIIIKSNHKPRKTILFLDLLIGKNNYKSSIGSLSLPFEEALKKDELIELIKLAEEVHNNAAFKWILCQLTGSEELIYIIERYYSNRHSHNETTSEYYGIPMQQVIKKS